METRVTKRMMLINLQPGQYVDHIVFQQGKPVHVELEVVRVEVHCNLGRLWTTKGPLSWQMLTSKYEVVRSQI